MTLASVLLVAQLAVSQTTIVVITRDNAKRPIQGAQVTVLRDDSPLFDAAPTDARGEVFLTDTSDYTSDDMLQVQKQNYGTYREPWPDGAQNRIRVPLRATREVCRHIVQKVVTESSLDGTTRCRTVYVEEERPCPPPGTIEFKLPTTPPPAGYRYKFAYVEKWYDADRGMNGYRPYYSLVPACEAASSTVPVTSCGCVGSH